MRKALIIAALIIPTSVGVATAAPDNAFGFRGWGPRIGLTSEPDQVHFGAHFDLGYLGDQVRFQPNFELGVGDGRTLGAMNFEAAYRFLSRWDAWSPYAGGGLGLNVVGRDDGLLGDTTTDVGLNAMAGIERGTSGGNRFFMEVKLGLTDSPGFKLTSGWTFYH
jgi:hypothetical protein